MDKSVRPRLRVRMRYVGDDMWFTYSGKWRGITKHWNSPRLNDLLRMLRYDGVI